MDFKNIVTKVRLQFVLNLIALTIVSQFNAAKAYADGLVGALSAGDIAFTHSSFNQATVDVEDALIELATKANSDAVSFEILQTPNTGKLKTYRFTKGTGAGATTMDIDIEKDLLNGTFQLVTITEDGGKYYDGSTEVTAAQGVTGTGVYMKYNSNAADENPSFSYADMSSCIEYLTVGNQTGKMVTLNIDPQTHQITADIADATLTKAKFVQSVQDSLDAADSAYQKPSTGIPATDLESAAQTALSNGSTAYGWGDHAQAGYSVPADFDQISEADCTAAWQAAMNAATTPAAGE